MNASGERSGPHVTMSSDEPGLALVEFGHPPGFFGSWELIEELDNTLADAEQQGARVVVLASRSQERFLAHAALDDILAMVRDEPTSGDGRSWLRIVERLDRGTMVSIAAVRGQAWGGGAELAWWCDLRVVGESATFAQPEVPLGIIPGLGGISRLSRLIGESATAEIVFEGRPFGADEASRLGLANRVVPDDEAVAYAVAWARRLAARPETALAEAKKVLSATRSTTSREALKIENRAFLKCASTAEAQDLMARALDRYAQGDDSQTALGL